MKTLNFYLFLLTALLCGALFCTDSSARVCFATDPDCGNGGNFGNMDGLKQYDDACKKAGYTYENSCPAEYIKYICPYKSTWLKCCGKQFRYEGCIYPLEIDKSQVGEVVDGVTQYGKCGTRYACKCPDEYEISSEYAETNNCQPGGGYCLQSDGTTDTVKYKTCTCDEDIYTDVSSCKNNQTETSSCKDAQGTVRKKCHCDRGVYPYAACEYGPSIGAKTCIDSNSGREYYSRCKTAEEACREEGFEYNECSLVKNCEHETLTKKVKTTCAKKILGVCVKWNYEYVPETSDNCILGPACPYPVNPGLYKCVFDKASWCTSRGYTSTMTTKPTEGETCTTPDGFTGTYSVCPGNDNNSLFYYNCTLPCEQEVRRALSKGYLTQDDQMVGDDGSVVGFVRTDGSNKHLYFTDDITLPKTYTNNTSWSNIGKKVDYASINGMYALADSNMKYPDGSPMFAGCEKERLQNIWKRPQLKIDGMMVGKTTWLVNKPISDLGINIYSSNNDNNEGYGEQYVVYDNTWKNVNIISQTPPRNAKISTDINYSFLGSRRSEIVIKGSNTLTLTGTIGLRIGAGCYTYTDSGANVANDFYTGACADISFAHIRLEGWAVVKFDNAIIDSWSYPSASWDGDNGSVLFYNTKMADSYSSAGNFWSNINVGLSNSDVRVNMIRTNGFAASNTGRRFGGYSDISGWENTGAKLWRCRGIYLTNNSTLRTVEAGFMSANTKIYVDWDSTLEASRPIKMENYQHSLICLDYSKIKINGKDFGTTSYKSYVRHYSHGGWLGSDNSYENINNDPNHNKGVWYYNYNKGNYDGQYPCALGGKFKGDGTFDPTWRDGYLCTGCFNCELMGMGY